MWVHQIIYTHTREDGNTLIFYVIYKVVKFHPGSPISKYLYFYFKIIFLKFIFDTKILKQLKKLKKINFFKNIFKI